MTLGKLFHLSEFLFHSLNKVNNTLQEIFEGYIYIYIYMQLKNI